MTTGSTLPRPPRAADRRLGPAVAATLRRWPLRGAMGILAPLAVAAGALLGQWYMPLVAGVVLGVLGRPGFGRTAGRAVAIGPVAWGLAMLPRFAGGQAVGATDRTVSALAGLPDLAATTLALTLLVAFLQGLVGLWLGRAALGVLRRGRRGSRPE